MSPRPVPISVLAAAALTLSAVLALARPPAGMVPDPQMQAWFESLQQPGSGVSCCGNADGRVLADEDVKMTKSGYEARLGGKWIAVPPSVILQRVDNPTGGFVVFTLPDDPTNILCFVRPAMT